MDGWMDGKNLLLTTFARSQAMLAWGTCRVTLLKNRLQQPGLIRIKIDVFRHWNGNIVIICAVTVCRQKLGGDTRFGTNLQGHAGKLCRLVVIMLQVQKDTNGVVKNGIVLLFPYHLSEQVIAS